MVFPVGKLNPIQHLYGSVKARPYHPLQGFSGDWNGSKLLFGIICSFIMKRACSVLVHSETILFEIDVDLLYNDAITHQAQRLLSLNNLRGKAMDNGGVMWWDRSLCKCK